MKLAILAGLGLAMVTSACDASMTVEKSASTTPEKSESVAKSESTPKEVAKASIISASTKIHIDGMT